MRLSDDTRLILEQMHLISGRTLDDCREFMESLYILVALNFMEGRETVFPLLGRLKLSYKGDEIKSGGRQAQVEAVFAPDPELLKVIGQIQDGDEHEAEKLIKKSIKGALERALSE